MQILGTSTTVVTPGSVLGDETEITSVSDSETVEPTKVPTNIIEKAAALKREIEAKDKARLDKLEAAQKTRDGKKELFTQKVKTISDDKKRELVENIDERISNIQSTEVKRLSSAIERIRTLLTKHATQAVLQGADTTDIAEATLALDAAQASVDELEAGIYTITLTNETNLRRDVANAGQTLKADIQSARAEVRAARDAAKKVLIARQQPPKEE